jgi:hypothetical protein
MYNQNKNIKEQLRDMDELPQGIHLDRSATWNKIEDRLQPKKHNKLAFLKFAAVFLLLICGVIAYMLQGGSSTKRSTGTAIANDPGMQNTGTIVAKTEAPIHTEKPITIKSIKPQQQPVIVTPLVQLRENNPSLVISSAVIDISVSETGIVSIPVNQNATVNTAPPVINTTIKKPRLRIVHLNDLYKPDPAEIAKAETKKQQAAEEVGETEPTNAPPPKPFWKSKAPIRIAISLTDNQ